MSVLKRIEELQKKIDYLQSKQNDFQKYIAKLQKELESIKLENIDSKSLNTLVKETNNDFSEAKTKSKELVKTQKVYKEPLSSLISKKLNFDWNIKDDFEKFIGTNLINKIGILILIFGVIVGAKYAIDNDIISPLTRIIIGYFISFALLATSMKLKAKYKSFSAVLLSGSLATLYFLSFIAYSFYNFISQPFTFVLMLIFTAFAVLASISYNKRIIALIGLVGSYAIPFLLSNNSGNVLFLFSYMAIINAGILFLSFKKYWKILYYSAFVFTWLIFGFWFFDSYYIIDHFNIGLVFSTIFFLTFYLTFLAYKLIRKEEFVKSDIIFILLNSFIFFSFGYVILSDHQIAKDYLGFFTVVNAIVHYIVSRIIFKQKDADKKLFYLASVLVLVFITMAIPVQLDGSWVTLLWALEAALLFWLGRTKKLEIYENISYPLMFLAFISMFQDWDSYSNYNNSITPIFNVTFLSALIVSISFGVIVKILFDKNYLIQHSQDSLKEKFKNLAKYTIPIMFIILLYFTFAKEIILHFDNLNHIIQTINTGDVYTNFYDFEALWVLFYSIVFVIILSFVNIKYIKSKKIASINLVLNSIVLFYALSAGLMYCSEIRGHYLYMINKFEYFNIGYWHLSIRYLNYALISLLVFTNYKIIKISFATKKNLQILFLAIHIIILWILSSELLHWMDLNGFKNAYKISLTILWSSYSLMSVAIGIWKQQKYLRIGAISLFALTLVKLLLYDLAHLSTIHKTIVLITVGVILLIVSFLYNKYANIISEK